MMQERSRLCPGIKSNNRSFHHFIHHLAVCHWPRLGQMQCVSSFIHHANIPCVCASPPFILVPILVHSRYKNECGEKWRNDRVKKSDGLIQQTKEPPKTTYKGLSPIRQNPTNCAKKNQQKIALLLGNHPSVVYDVLPRSCREDLRFEKM